MARVATTQAASNKGVIPSYSLKIFEFDSQETPFYAGVTKSGPPKEVIHNFPVDLPSYVSNIGKRQGAPPKAAKPQTDAYDVLQTTFVHITETVGVTKVMELMRNRAGIGNKKELAKQIAKVFLAMKEAVERTNLDAGDCAVETEDLSTVNATRGAFSWCSNTAQSALPVPEKYRTPTEQIYSGTFADFRESHLISMIRGIWERTGRKMTLQGIIGSDLQIKIDAWQKSDTLPDGEVLVRRFNGTEGELKAMVNILKTSFGNIRLTPSRYLLRTRGKTDAQHTSTELSKARRCGIFFADDSFEMAVTQAPMIQPIGDSDSSGQSREVDTIFSLCGRPLLLAKVDVAGA